MNTLRFIFSPEPYLFAPIQKTVTRIARARSDVLDKPVQTRSLARALTSLIHNVGVDEDSGQNESRRDFQQCGILTSVDTDDPMQPPFKLRNTKWYSASSLTLIENSCDKQSL